MSDFENPYQVPETQVVPETKQKSGIELTVVMLQYLNQASPWLRFIGILGYVFTSLSILGGLIAFISMLALGTALNSTFDLPSAFGFGIGIFIAIYIPVCVAMFFISHYIFMFGHKIRSFKFTNSIEDLEIALKNNKSLWKLIGILLIAYLALLPVMFIIALIISVAGVLGTF